MVDWYYIYSILALGVYPSPQSIYNVVHNYHISRPSEFLLFIAIAMAEVPTPNLLAISAIEIPIPRLK